ncbi:unnamed protein product [Paramecium sonneborni]|uniref:G-protein coupled receptors family 1 profile domain-containing protein n=1 Tax=Paramecium sonneborni TaxID=65129 RepID=A0A8S1LV07_9CILI|nr:unnamed protein product [Paramecium sonneborni]
MEESGNTLYLTLLIIISVLSLFGCTVLLINYLKQRHRTQLATKLFAILSISDAIYVIAVVANPMPQTDGTFCVIQALFKQLSSLATFIVNFFFCFTTFLTIVNDIRLIDTNYKIYKRNVNIFSILFPFIIALIPLTYNGYGKQYYACSLKTQNTFWIGALLLQYLPFGFLFGASLFFLLKIQRFLREIQQNKADDNKIDKFNDITFLSKNSQINEGEQYIRVLSYYTLVHFFCWLPIIISSIVDITLQRDLIWFEGISYIIACSQGFFDLILFRISKQVSLKIQYFESNNSILSGDHNDIYRGSGSALYISRL